MLFLFKSKITEIYFSFTQQQALINSYKVLYQQVLKCCTKFLKLLLQNFVRSYAYTYTVAFKPKTKTLQENDFEMLDHF